MQATPPPASLPRRCLPAVAWPPVQARLPFQPPTRGYRTPRAASTSAAAAATSPSPSLQAVGRDSLAAIMATATGAGEDEGVGRGVQLPPSVGGGVSENAACHLPWRARIESAMAACRTTRGGNFVQLATADAEGRPHCRTVVFRGFLPPQPGSASGAQGPFLKMITDGRSAKVGEIRSMLTGELVWWFPATSEQYRFAGDLQLVTASSTGNLQAVRHRQWDALSDPAREQFFWNMPGVPYEGPCISPAPSLAGLGPEGAPRAGTDETAAGEAASTIAPAMPDNFFLLLLLPRRVKYLRLTDNLAMVDTEVVGTDGRPTWTYERVNP